METQMEAFCMKTYSSNSTELPIMFAKNDTEFYHDARMYYFNNREMHFESTIDLEPDTDIHILMDSHSSDTFSTNTYKSYRAIVKSCKELLDGYSFNYRIGIQINEPV